MGNNCCGGNLTPEERERLKRSKNLDKGAQDDFDKEKQIKKLLLLGAGESGKSTLFKQAIQIYGQGFSNEERLTYACVVFNNVVNSMKALCRFHEELPKGVERAPISEDNVKHMEHITSLPSANSELSEETVAAIKALWKEQGILDVYEHRSLFQLPDSAKYFFDKVDEIGVPDFVPTEQDVLRARVRTTGIVEVEFEIDDQKFRMFDVGGQRNERKKWIHCFEDVTAVIFVAAISEYDQMLYEDQTVSRVQESLNLFNEICNSEWFTHTNIILFLNKEDLFDEKISKKPITVCESFKDYEGPPDDNAASKQYIMDKYRAQNHSDTKEVYTYVTTATNKENIRNVLLAVKDIVIKGSLKEGGLM